MAVDIKVWSDFVCPFCMIAERPLLEAIDAARVDVALEWMPFELRPFPHPTLRPEDRYLQTVWPRSVYPIARQFGVDLHLPSVSPQPYTALAWEGYQFAREHGLGTAYNDRVLRAFFQEDLDIGQQEVLVRLAGALGLDAAAFRAALEQHRYRAAHEAALAQAVEQGIQSVPTLLIGDRRLTGVQPKEVLIQTIRAAANAGNGAQYGA